MLRFKFIGHCYDPKENLDKVWGAIYLDNPDDNRWPRVLTFWGRRGKKLQTKLGIDDWDLTKLCRNKESKGYQEITANRLSSVYPEFQEDLEKTVFWSMLKF